jgi:hypothetical protein
MSTRTIAGITAALIATSASAAFIAQAGSAPVARGNHIVAMSAHRAIPQRLEATRARCSSDNPAWNGSNCRLVGETTPLPGTAGEVSGAAATAAPATAAVAIRSNAAGTSRPSIADPTAPVFGPQSNAADGWVTKSILDQDAPVVVPTINAAVITVDGKPRQSDPRYYDLTINAGGTGSTNVSVYSAGAMTMPLHADLLHLDSNTARVGLHLSYHYNSNQPVCLVQVLSTCAAHLPVDPANPTWISNHMNEATLTIQVTATVNGNLVSQKLDIPVAGQAGAILP